MENKNKTKSQLKPIIAYGNSVLRKECAEVKHESDKIEWLIENLWSALDYSGGIGLAAPQINDSYKVFVVNSRLFYNEIDAENRAKMFSGDQGIEETFINAKIISSSDEKWKEQEGCLSIPGIFEDVERPWEIVLEYRNAKMELIKKHFSGYTAKVIQHELDHTRGVLFVDHLSVLSKRLLSGKLKKVKNGKIQTEYPIRFAKR